LSGSPQIDFKATGKSAVCGLNDLRPTLRVGAPRTSEVLRQVEEGEEFRFAIGHVGWILPSPPRFASFFRALQGDLICFPGPMPLLRRPGLIKLAGIIRILSGLKTKLNLFTGVPGQRKRGDLVLAHEFDSCCFHARLRFASQQPAKYE
jgi:hypothetical protein